MNQKDPELAEVRRRIDEVLELKDVAGYLKSGALERLNFDEPPEATMMIYWTLVAENRRFVRGFDRYTLIDHICHIVSDHLTEYDQVSIFGVERMYPIVGTIALRLEIRLRILGY